MIGIRFFRIALLCLFCPAVFADVPVIDLGYASYVGAFNATSNITRYLGIRYAAPPSGDLRFRAPQAPSTTNTSEVIQATTAPQSCNQAATGTSPTNPFVSSSTASDDTAKPNDKRQVAPDTEDCLFLNVFFPGAAVPTVKLPVVVWIHGGGYIAGSAPAVEDLVRESNNSVVSVLIQYRLGLFGFLASQSVKDGGALNAGLLDQEFALKWVRENIAKFGGDPSLVTIWGESAGAGSVFQHVIAHGGETNPPLFRAAITSSTFLPSQYLFNDTVPETIYSEVLAATNCTSLDCLRTVPAASFEAVNNAINLAGFFGTFVTVPVIDGDFIVQSPTKSLIERKVNGHTLLSVTNSFEGRIFVNQTSALASDVSAYASELFPDFTSQAAGVVGLLYNAPDSGIIGIMGESIFICPTYLLMQAFDTAFKGEYAVPPANHGDDVAYYFPTGSTPTFPNAQFAAAFSGSFLSFVKSLNPSLPNWEEWNLSSRDEMVFNKTMDNLPDIAPSSTDEALLERCGFWVSVANLTGQ